MSEQHISLDLFVVGGGPAGLTLAERAIQHGLTVGIADKAGMGHNDSPTSHAGLFLSFADGPQKLMHLVSQLTDLKSDQNECGFSDKNQKPLDWQRLVGKMAENSHDHRQRVVKSLLTKGVRLFAAKAMFVEAHKLELILADGQRATVEAKHVVIAIGSSIVPLEIPGAKELSVFPDELFLMEKIPGRTLIVGSSYQALELAGFLRAVGSQVSVLYDKVIEADLDKEIISKMTEFLTTFHEINLVNGKIVKIEKVNGHTVATWTSQGGSELSDAFDVIFNCGFRHVPVNGLQVDKVGMELTEFGSIKVNERFETSVKGVYAIGEASANGLTFAGLVSKQAAVLSDGLLLDKWRPVDPKKLPNLLWTPIEYGFIGFGEDEAIAKFGADDVDAYYSTFKPLEWNFNDKRKAMSCFTKVIHHNKDDRVLGIHYLGPNAGDVIQGLAVVVSLGLKIADLQETIGIHPTTAEEVVNIKNNKRYDDPNANAESNC